MLPPKVYFLDALFFEKTLARKAFRWCVPSSLSLSLSSQLSREGQSVIIVLCYERFEFLNCLSGRLWLLNFAE